MSKKRILVLGGTGFVGSRVCQLAVKRGYEVVSLSRRAPKDEGKCSGVEWVLGDATSLETIDSLMQTRGPFVGYVHCIGALFDGQTSLRKMNWMVSGCGSVASAGFSYDDITKRTAVNLLSSAVKFEDKRKEERANTPIQEPANQSTVDSFNLPFVFVSAAEAGWPDMHGGGMIEAWLAPSWLKRYLAAKRSVEAAIIGEREVRGVIMRPSFVWSWSKLDILLPTFIFSIGNTLGVPFLDHPVHRDTIARAVLVALENDGVKGVQRYSQMEALGKQF